MVHVHPEFDSVRIVPYKIPSKNKVFASSIIAFFSLPGGKDTKSCLTSIARSNYIEVTIFVNISIERMRYCYGLDKMAKPILVDTIHLQILL
jgi:hypothetical protein